MKILNYELISAWEQKLCECALCKTKKSVKYKAEIEIPSLSNGMPMFNIKINICNKCLLTNLG